MNGNPRSTGGTDALGMKDADATPAAEPPVATPAPKAKPRLPPRRSVEERAQRCLKSENPLLAAAMPLLRAMTDLPALLRQDQKATLKAMLVEAVLEFQAVCERLDVRRDHMLAASYSLCTALDEAVIRQPWGGTGWAVNSLLIQVHGDTGGGVKVFQLMGRLVKTPNEHIDVIQLMYRLISLGFVGRYAGQADGPRTLETLRQQLYGLIATARGNVPHELSPHWRGETEGRFGMLRTVPVWVSWSVMALAVFGVFSWNKYQLMQKTAALEQVILSIGKDVPAPPEPRATLRLAELLKPEIARGVVSVREDSTSSAVTFRGDDMFGGGKAEVSARMLPLLDKVAAEIAKVGGKVTVIGHSDNMPIRTAKFPSNQALSEERAATVTEYLAGRGVAKGRLEAIGRGDTAPLTDNRTPAARAQNRRVEIVVTQ